MDWTPHVTVATVIEQNGRFLMVEETVDGIVVINQPAGHLENNESLIDAAIRETLEETAWEIRINAVLGLSLYRSPNSGITYHRTTFTGSALRQIPEQALDKGILRALWMSHQDIVDNSHQLRSPLVLQSVEQYLSGRSYPLDLIDDAGVQAAT